MKIVKKIIVWTLVTVFFIFAIGMSILLLNHNEYGIPQFGDTTLVVIHNHISSEDYEEGDLVIVREKRIQNIEVGDSIFAYRKLEDDSIEIDLGVIGEVYENDGAIAYENGSQFTMPYVVGEASDSYAGIGTFLAIIQSTWVFLFVIVVPCFLIFIYQIYALIVEIRYGSDDEDEEEEEEVKEKPKTKKTKKTKEK